LRAFDQIVPQGAERIFVMAEKEQAHRIQMETTGQTAAIRDTRRGQVLGALVSVLALAGAVGLAYFEHAITVPLALLSVPVMSVAYALIRGRVRTVARPPGQ